MTLPIERTNAVLNVERFLMDLRDPKKTPRLPSAIRKQASSLLKHYPRKFDMMYPAESFEAIKEWSYED
jgi:hypothetical protein